MMLTFIIHTWVQRNGFIRYNITLYVLRDFDGCDAAISADENTGVVDGWSYKAIC